MQNINPVYFLQPIITILFSVGLVVYWRYRRRLTRAVLLYSLLAYAAAIAAKAALQSATYASFQASFGENPYLLGTYLGLQTVIFEVGVAFLVAAWAVSRGKLNAPDAEGYGLSLAMWENAGLLGILGLVNLIAIYVTIALGGAAAESLSILTTSAPYLFYSPPEALPLVAWGVLERVTSLLIHLSWGILTLLAACLHKRQYLLLALPMGLIDFSVPFAVSVDIAVFEASLFALSLGCLGLTLFVTKGLRRGRNG